MNDEIEPIIPCKMPHGMDDKIFCLTDDEGNEICEKYSMNDFIKKINGMSGVNEDLLSDRKG